MGPTTNEGAPEDSSVPDNNCAKSGEKGGKLDDDYDDSI